MLIDKTKIPIIIHQVFILDESASMGYIAPYVRQGFSELIKDLKTKEKELSRVRTLITLVKFSKDVTILECGKPVEEFDINSIQYMPDGMTALYDAIYYTRNRVLEEISSDKSGHQHRVVVNIYTDGQENHSEYQEGPKVVSDMKRRGWIVNLFGTEDGFLEASKLGVEDANSVSLNSSREDTLRSYSMASKAAINYSSAIEGGAKTVNDYLMGFGGVGRYTPPKNTVSIPRTRFFDDKSDVTSPYYWERDDTE